MALFCQSEWLTFLLQVQNIKSLLAKKVGLGLSEHDVFSTIFVIRIYNVYINLKWIMVVIILSKLFHK